MADEPLRVALPPSHIRSPEHEELWDIISSALTHEVEIIPGSEWMNGSFKDGDWLQQFSQSSMVDVLYYTQVMSQYRLSWLNFSNSIIDIQAVFSYESTDLSDEQLAEDYFTPAEIITVFSWRVWLSLSVVMLVLLIANQIVVLAAHQLHDSITLSQWQIFEHFLLQKTRSDCPTKLFASRCMMVMVGLFALHSTVMYQGCLLGALVTEKPPQAPFDSVQSLVDMIDRKMAVLDLRHEASPLAQRLNFEQTPLMKSFRAALRHNPPIYSITHPEITPPPGQVRFVATYDKLFLENFDEINCNAAMIHIGHTEILGFPISNHANPAKVDELNEAIGHNIDLLITISQRYTNFFNHAYQLCRDQRLDRESPKPGLSPISLTRLTGIAATCAYGWIIAVFVCVLENFIKMRGRSP